MFLCKDFHGRTTPKDVMEIRIMLRMPSRTTKSVFTHLEINLRISQFSCSGTAIIRAKQIQLLPPCRNIHFPIPQLQRFRCFQGPLFSIPRQPPDRDPHAAHFQARYQRP